MRFIERLQRFDVGGWQTSPVRWAVYALAMIALLSVCLWPVKAQNPQPNGTPHGIELTITPPTTIGGSGVIQGYFVFRCTSGCSASSSVNWTAITGLIAAASQTAPTSYLDPASGLSSNTTYNYEAVTVDSNGDQSPFMPTVTVVAVTTFPANPGTPSLTGKVQ